MSPFQMILKTRSKVKNGKSPIPAHILRAFQNETRFLQRERARQAVKAGLIKKGGN